MKKARYTILCGEKNTPRVLFAEFPINEQNYNFNEAQEELLSAIKGKEDPLWGYFPQHPDQHFVNAVPLPACRALEESLRKNVLDRYGVFQDLTLAFIRLCLRDIRGKEHGGFHIDLDPGSAFLGDARNDGTRNICRLLFNLHPTEARELRYLENSLEELSTLGLTYTRDSYRGVPEEQLPKGAIVRSVFVPPRTKEVLHAVIFWSNLVPHTGVDHAHGHFVAGFGGFRKNNVPLV